VDKDVAVALIGATATTVAAGLGYLGARATKPSAGTPKPTLTATGLVYRTPRRWSIGAGLTAAVIAVAVVVGGAAALASRGLIAEPPPTPAPTTSSPRTRPALIMPNVIGQTEDVARSTLAAAGLTRVSTAMVDSPRPAGQVILTDPAAGESVTPDGMVRIEISRGPGWPSNPDCIAHDPVNLNITYDASLDMWKVVEGGHSLLAFTRQVDAQAGLALARAYRKHCFIGRGNTRAEHDRYVMDYWLDPVQAPVIPNPDCIAHDGSALYIDTYRASDGPVWRVRTAAELIAGFATEADARDAILVMKHFNRHCYITRGSSSVEWFASVG